MEHEYDFDAVIGRLKWAVDAGSINELADLLGLSSSGIANYKKRNSIPFERVAALARSRNVSIDWVLSGDGEAFRAGMVCAPGAAESSMSTAQKLMLRAIEGLNEDQQRRVAEEACRAREIIEMQQRLEKLEAEKAQGQAESVETELETVITQTINAPVKQVAGRSIKNIKIKRN